jgi:hypothetical protein
VVELLDVIGAVVVVLVPGVAAVLDDSPPSFPVDALSWQAQRSRAIAPTTRAREVEVTVMERTDSLP